MKSVTCRWLLVVLSFVTSHCIHSFRYLAHCFSVKAMVRLLMCVFKKHYVSHVPADLLVLVYHVQTTCGLRHSLENWIWINGCLLYLKEYRVLLIFWSYKHNQYCSWLPLSPYSVLFPFYQGPVIYAQLDHSGSKNSFHKMEPVVYADIRKN